MIWIKAAEEMLIQGIFQLVMRDQNFKFLAGPAALDFCKSQERKPQQSQKFQ